MLSWILVAVFGLVLLSAAVMNLQLNGKSRKALATCVLSDRPDSPLARYHLMVVIPDLNDSFFHGLVEGILAFAPKTEAAVQIFRYPSTLPGEAEQYFEIAMKAKVDGLIMYLPRNDHTPGRPEKAAQSGVIFIPVGTDAPVGSKAGFIGLSSMEHGFEGGKRICAKLGGMARIGVILPSTGSGEPGVEPCYRGIEAALKGYPGACVVATARTQPDILSGEETASTMLRSYPTLNAIFCANAKDTIGAAQVVVDMNKVGTILIVGTDETKEITRYVDKGVIAATILRDSKRIGEEAVQAFFQRKDGLVRAQPRGLAPRMPANEATP